MAKLPRKTQKIFCSNPTSENQTSVFGTMKTSDKQYSTDVGTLQSNAAYEQGWKSATIASYKPFMEDFNTLNYINTSQLAYLFQQGIPEWDEATAYYKNSFCSYNGDLWQSLIDDNLGNAPFEGDEWTLFTSKNKGGGLELCDIGTALYVDETQGLRRRLNGSILAITNNTQAFLTRLKQIVTLYPSLVCTEDEWQTIKTMSKLGQCGKFVLNYADDGITVESVRLPAVVNINGLVDMANCGLIKDESLPNLRGNISTVTANIGAADGVFKAEDAARNWNIGNNQQNHFYRASFDASRFSTTYKDNASVQQEAIQYPYFIQVATGSETENNIVNDIELNNPYVLFDNKYVEAPLYNISWLKSDGEYKPKATFIKPYEALVVENNSSIAVGTTVDLPSGTKYTKRGLSVKLSTDESATDYDFRINTTDETFRLPLKNHSAGDGNVNLILYFYVGETVQNANLIDAGRMAEELGNVNSSSRGYLVESYVNDTSGYRLYSDKYIEQWGLLPSGQNLLGNIELLKPMANTNYCITQAEVNRTGGQNQYCNGIYFNALTTTTVHYQYLNDGTSNFSWFLCGYAR